MDTQQGRAVFPIGTQQAEVRAGLSDSELSVLPGYTGNCPPPSQAVPWYWLLKKALRTWGPSLFSELSLFWEVGRMHGASKESLLSAERHPGSEPVQTWQWQRGQASPAVLPSTSFCSSFS